MALDAPTLGCVSWQNCYLLSDTTPQWLQLQSSSALSSCMSFPLFIKPSGCAISCFSSLPSPRDVCLLSLPCSGAFPFHSCLLQDSELGWLVYRHYSEVIKSTCSHAQSQYHAKDLANFKEVSLSLCLRVLLGLFTNTVIGFRFYKKYFFQIKCL